MNGQMLDQPDGIQATWSKVKCKFGFVNKSRDFQIASPRYTSILLSSSLTAKRMVLQRADVQNFSDATSIFEF